MEKKDEISIFSSISFACLGVSYLERVLWM